MKLDPKTIIIGERQRIELGDPLSELASMADPEVGQINAITVEKTDAGYKLIAGRRRLEFALRANWPTIEAVERLAMTERERQKIELFEDLERKDRSWQEYCLTHLKLYELFKEEGKIDPSRNSLTEGHRSWSVRAMAKFTGMSKSNMSYSLELARFLRAVPRDEELWTAPGYTFAVQIIYNRRAKEAQDEMDLRRVRAAAKAAVVAPPELETVISIDPDAPAPDLSRVQLLDKDLEPPKVIMTINGYNIDFHNAIAGKHYKENQFNAAIIYNSSHSVGPAMNDKGITVNWEDAFNKSGPIDIIWNKIHAHGPCSTPFIRNFALGTFHRWNPWTENEFPNPSGSVISCVQSTPGELPNAVVNFTLDAICPMDTVVLLPCNAPVLEVAQSGRVPYFFEADSEKFKAKVAALTQYYEETIPGVEVRLVAQ